MSNQSYQLAKLHIALEEVKQRIYGEIIPLSAHLAPAETAEMAQALELAAQSIEAHQKQYRLVAEESRKLFGDDVRESYPAYGKDGE
jgi:hypothetical protein